MSAGYRDIAFTPSVKDAQARFGSRELYHRAETRRRGRSGTDRLGPTERAFIAERDGLYMATVSETGWPYVQFRGGPTGFVRVVDERTLAWADYRGNLQYISTGNLAHDDRVSLFFMDYVHQRRLKLFGRARTEPAEGLDCADADPDDGDAVEQLLIVTVEAYDWNCPRHITPRFTLAEIDALELCQ